MTSSTVSKPCLVPSHADALPDDRTVLAFSFSDVEPEMRDWWLVLTPDEIHVCEHDPLSYFASVPWPPAAG